MNENAYTDFLVSRGGFLIGMGSCLNLSGEYFEYNLSVSDKEADARALRSDWEQTGNDLASVMRAHDQDNLSDEVLGEKCEK